MKPQQYRKKPVVVEAMQWDGTDANAWLITKWSGWPYNKVEGHPFGERRLRIKTIDSVAWAEPEDWIIKGTKGEFYPCKPDIFEETYEVVDEQ